MVKSSKLLGISQPALSRQLKDFESMIGQSLFKTQGRNKVLTPLGNEIFQKLSSKWVNFSSVIHETVDSFASGPRSPIKVYGPSDMMTRLALQLRTEMPLDFVPAESEDIENLLNSNEVNLGISRVVHQNSQLVSKQLFQLDFYLVFPKTWKIEETSFGIKILKKLSEYPRILFRRDSMNKNLISILDKFAIKNLRIIPNWLTILKMVQAGQGWALAPIDVLDFYDDLKEDLVTIKIPHEIVQPVKYYLLYRKDLSKVTWIKELVQEILDSESSEKV